MLNVEDERAAEVLIDFLEFANVSRLFDLAVDLTCQSVGKDIYALPALALLFSITI